MVSNRFAWHCKLSLNYEGWLEKPTTISKQVFLHELDFWAIPLAPVVDNDNTLTVELKLPVDNPRSLGKDGPDLLTERNASSQGNKKHSSFDHHSTSQ